MAFAKPYTQRELDYIRDNWESTTPAEMAAHLGRSARGVYKKIRDMHLRETVARAQDEPMHEKPKKAATMRRKEPKQTDVCIGDAMTDHDRMAALRDLIWANLQVATPAEVARLAPEYRRTIEEMSDGGGDEQGGEDGDAGASLADVISF